MPPALGPLLLAVTLLQCYAYARVGFSTGENRRTPAADQGLARGAALKLEGKTLLLSGAARLLAARERLRVPQVDVAARSRGGTPVERWRPAPVRPSPLTSVPEGPAPAWPRPGGFRILEPFRTKPPYADLTTSARPNDSSSRYLRKRDPTHSRLTQRIARLHGPAPASQSCGSCPYRPLPGTFRVLKSCEGLQ